jgi:hypothetical protein
MPARDQPSRDWWLADAAKSDGIVVFDEDFEVIASVEMQLLADLARQHDLAFL